MHKGLVPPQDGVDEATARKVKDDDASARRVGDVFKVLNPLTRHVIHAGHGAVHGAGGGLDGQDADRGGDVGEVEDVVVVGRRGGQLEGVADGGPLVGEVVDVGDDEEVLEDHLGPLPLEAVGPVVVGELLHEEDLGAQLAHRRQRRLAVVEGEVPRGAAGRQRRRVAVVVEGVLEGDGVVVADGRALLLEAHDDGLGRVRLEKVKHGQQHVGVAEPRVAVGVVDVQLVVAQAGADVKVAQAGVELRADVPLLALELLAANRVRHGVVRAGDAEAREVDVVAHRRHPRRVVRLVGVEAEDAVVAAVARRTHQAGRHGRHKVPRCHYEGHDPENDDGETPWPPREKEVSACHDGWWRCRC